ncbi:MAG: hypothetical protein QM682_11315 [Paracoccus sp. (in: a-proteobacteria)]|uniref:hypothetical protein n=1 Tax=Paracoccus sp. TaxID=267 RepID=UPI0039E60294
MTDLYQSGINIEILLTKNVCNDYLAADDASPIIFIQHENNRGSALESLSANAAGLIRELIRNCGVTRLGLQSALGATLLFLTQN